MPVSIIVSPYKDPALGPDWIEQTPQIFESIVERLSAYPNGPVEYLAHETDHGIGADWPTIVIEIVKWGAGLAFSVPATHKLIRTTISEWKVILANLRKLLQWFSGDLSPISYSIEVAFLEALERLESETDPNDLEFLSCFSIPGKPGRVPAAFNTSLLVYYGFVFREGSSEKAFLLVYTSQLKEALFEVFELDHRLLMPNHEA